MSVKNLVLSIVAFTLLCFGFGTAFTQAQLLPNPFRKTVEADPNKEYFLTQQCGPWMILVTTFPGEQGRQKANALVYEIRKHLNLEAYVYGKSFEHDLKKEGQSRQNPYARRVNYQNKGVRQEFVVLVGNYSSVDDKSYETDLKKIKEYTPQFTKDQAKIFQVGSQDITDWRQVVNRKNPFYVAFGVRNPMLPTEQQQGTVDAFIERINKDRPYSLLKNPGLYTVQIATFTGKVVIKQDEIKKILDEEKKNPNKKSNGRSELELGEQSAVRLCLALRKAGVEAYEFHDRNASIVTVGSFNTYGQHLPNGLIETNPAILQVIEAYRAKPAPFNQRGAISFQPRTIDGVECDVQPKVIAVPKRQAVATGTVRR